MRIILKPSLLSLAILLFQTACENCNDDEPEVLSLAIQIVNEEGEDFVSNSSLYHPDQVDIYAIYDQDTVSAAELFVVNDTFTFIGTSIHNESFFIDYGNSDIDTLNMWTEGRSFDYGCGAYPSIINLCLNDKSCIELNLKDDKNLLDKLLDSYFTLTQDPSADYPIHKLVKDD